ncbi:hypothetical protein [Burkholderia metallica]|uniref:hypothetical protein n=2 Tax=Burkholderia metallica TaxID=488729 RepID=UPI001452D07E|nr:hypothetical protein [Burkholderia metallica]VWB90864.1 beta-ketothiolase [Burkholderia metallica]
MPATASHGRLMRAHSRPLAHVVAYAHGRRSGLHGNRPRARDAQRYSRARLTVADLDMIDANEAFAARRVCGDAGAGSLGPARVNPNGAGIFLGHPIGATGALITGMALYELQHIGGRHALVMT